MEEQKKESRTLFLDKSIKLSEHQDITLTFSRTNNGKILILLRPRPRVNDDIKNNLKPVTISADTPAEAKKGLQQVFQATVTETADLSKQISEFEKTKAEEAKKTEMAKEEKKKKEKEYEEKLKKTDKLMKEKKYGEAKIVVETALNIKKGKDAKEKKEKLDKLIKKHGTGELPIN